MLCAVIMAGGKGTRFWPKSTEDYPKQFLNLVSDTKTMIQLTFDRINNTIPVERIFVVTCEKYKDIVKKQLPKLNDENIIIEPVGRNTAPCILLSCLYIKQIYNDANIVVLPSDHIVLKENLFNDILLKADKFIKENNKSILTLGITPTRPETGYGYIKCGDIINSNIKVEKFVEKPNIDKAKEYLKAGNYLWNAGIFIFNINYMLDELKDKFKEGYNLLCKLPSISDSNYNEILKNEYKKCENISIDYAVMEKCNSMYVIPADLGWDDVGTWNSLRRYEKSDKNNNILKGNIVIENCNNCIGYGGSKKIILFNLENVFVVEGDDTIVISDINSMNDIRKFRGE